MKYPCTKCGIDVECFEKDCNREHLCPPHMEEHIEILAGDNTNIDF